MADNITHLSDATFDEQVQGESLPYLVDFWAEWCGPCKAVAPILADLATAQADKLRVGKVNIDDFPELSYRFEVMSIPTLILFKDGQEKRRIIGARGKGQLLEELREFL